MAIKEDAKKQIDEAVEQLQILKNEDAVPKNIKIKVTNMITFLNSNDDLSLIINKSLHELDEIAEDINLPTFIRTQVWNISSMLEKLHK